MALPPGPSAHPVRQGIRWTRDAIGYLEACRAEFGESFTGRFPWAGETVFTSDPGLIKAIFASDRENAHAGFAKDVLGPFMGPRSVMFSQGEQHLRQRKLLVAALHQRSDEYEELIRGLTEEEVSSWPPGQSFRLHPRMRALTLDVILRVVIGIREPERHDRLRQLLERAFEYVTPPALTLRGLLASRLPFYSVERKLRPVVKEIDSFLAAEIAARRSDSRLRARDDVLSQLAAARNGEGLAMDDVEIRDQLMTLVHAGAEPSAAGLAWGFDSLLRAPDALDRLRDSGGDERYAAAVVRETLRLRSIVPIVSRDLGSEHRVDGHNLPAGTTVAICIYLAHTRRDVYPDPYEFRPERFLDGGPETFSWIPFGGGTRRCIGAPFAELEMRVIFDHIARSTVLRPTAGPARPKLANANFKPDNGIPVVLESRR
jgi:cytochrome P450